MAQKLKEEKERKIQIQEKLIKSLRRMATNYNVAVNSNITVVNIGHRTGLYKEIRSLMGWFR